jgi:hypothetical protein
VTQATADMMRKRQDPFVRQHRLAMWSLLGIMIVLAIAAYVGS